MTVNTTAMECRALSVLEDEEMTVEVYFPDGSVAEFLSPVNWYGSGVYESLTIYTYCHQDHVGIQTWVCFLYNDARKLFRKLLRIKGVGLKTALDFLNKNDPHHMLSCFKNNDARGFSLCKGINTKMGQKIMVDLFPNTPVEKTALDADALTALLALGYKKQFVEETLRKIMQNNKGADTGELVRMFLKS